MSSFNPAFANPALTSQEFNHIISNPSLLQKPAFVQNDVSVIWNGTAFLTMQTVVTKGEEAAILSQWEGANAQIWIFDVSLKRMVIRIYKPKEPQLIYVAAVNCEHIVGPFAWKMAQIKVIRDPIHSPHPTMCFIVDSRAGIELRCSDAQVLCGPSSDFEKTFEDFLGRQ